MVRGRRHFEREKCARTGEGHQGRWCRGNHGAVCEGLPGVYCNYLVPMQRDKQAEEREKKEGGTTAKLNRLHKRGNNRKRDGTKG
jgi:hypothetical protein